ncbi:MAG: hypoxanthine phosphoribosyltransferase [Clostridia bacterium]|nr:hypoxanthine phosphoribosyltransferase [Clostridia bacterium]
MYEILEEVLIDKETLAKRIAELGATLDKDYAGKIPLMICVLKGSVLFYSDLVRSMKNNVEFTFLTLSSYGDGFSSTGQVRMLKDIFTPVEGRDVIVVEDIVDSGNTMKYLLDELYSKNPASVKVVTLLNKASRRQVEVPIDYVGFEIPDKFIVGYGLDFKNVYRNIPEIGVLKEEYYK